MSKSETLINSWIEYEANVRRLSESMLKAEKRNLRELDRLLRETVPARHDARRGRALHCLY